MDRCARACKIWINVIFLFQLVDFLYIRLFDITSNSLIKNKRCGNRVHARYDQNQNFKLLIYLRKM